MARGERFLRAPGWDAIIRPRPSGAGGITRESPCVELPIIFSTKDRQPSIATAITVSPSALDAVRRYIARQQEHPRRKTFQGEYLELLKQSRIALDSRYLW